MDWANYRVLGYCRGDNLADEGSVQKNFLFSKTMLLEAHLLPG